MEQLSGKIQKALKRRRNGNLSVGVDGIHEDVVEALDAIARDSGTNNRSDIIWKAIRVYLYAYLNTRKGLAE